MKGGEQAAVIDTGALELATDLERVASSETGVSTVAGPPPVGVAGPLQQQREMGNQALLGRTVESGPQGREDARLLQQGLGNQALLQRSRGAGREVGSGEMVSGAPEPHKEESRPAQGMPTPQPVAASKRSARGHAAPTPAKGEGEPLGRAHKEGKPRGAPAKRPPSRPAPHLMVTLPRAAPAIDLPEPLVITQREPTLGSSKPASGPTSNALQARAEVATLADQLAESGERYKGRIRERAAAVKDRMADNAVSQRNRALGKATQTELTIVGEVKSARAHVFELARSFKPLTQAQALLGWTQISAATGSQISALQKSRKEHQDAARIAVTTRQQAARSFGASEGKRGKDAGLGAADEVVNRGEAKAAGYPGDERGKVQANAVRAVATKMANGLIKPAQDIEDEAIKQGNELASGFGGAADDIVSGMGDQAQFLATQLSISVNGQLPVFQSLAETTGKAIDHLASDVGHQLDAVESGAKRELHAVRADLQSQFDTALRLGQTVVDGEVASMEKAIDAVVVRAARTARGIARPNPGHARRALQTIDETLGGAVKDFEGGLTELDQRALQSYSDAGTAAAGSLARIGTTVQGHLAQAVKAAAGGLGTLLGKQLEEQSKIVERWKAELVSAQASIDTRWGALVHEVGSKLDELLNKGKPPITKSVNEAVAKHREPLAELDEKMEDAAEEARYKYDKPIRYKLKRAFWAALKAVGMLVLVIAAAILAVFAIIFGLLTGMIWLAVIGVVALVAIAGVVIYGIVSGIVHRVKSGTTIGEKIWGGFVGILDITGIPNIVEGIWEKDIVNGRQLTLEEAGDRLGGGVVAFLTLVIPFVKGLKGVRGARGVPIEGLPEGAPVLPEAPVAPIEPVGKAPAPTVEAPTAPKVEPPRVEPAAGAGPTVEAPKVEAPKVEAPKVEGPAAEAPKVEPPKAEPPKAEPPKAEPPKAEPPKAEPPKAEPPKAEPPKAEPPKAEPPKAEPKTEPPKAEAEKAEAPKTEPSTAEPAKQPTTAEKVAEAERSETGPRPKATSLAEVAKLREKAPRLESPPEGLTELGRSMWPEYVKYYEQRLKAIEGDIKAGKVPADPGPLPWAEYFRFRSRFKLAMEFQHEQTSAIEGVRKDLAVREEVSVESAAKEKVNIERRTKIEAGEESTRPAPDRADQLGLKEDQLRDYQTGKRTTPPEGEAFSNKRRDLKEYSSPDALVEQTRADGAEAITKYGGDVKVESAKFDRAPAAGEPAPRSLVGQKVPVKKVWVIYDGSLIKDPGLRFRIRMAVQEGSGFKATAVFSDELSLGLKN